MPESLASTWPLVRLALRRDRWLLPAWILGLSAMAGLSASATVDLYPTEASRLAAAEVLNASGAVVALYGRVYDSSSLGELSMIKLTAFGAAIIGIVSMFIVIRHARAEEESGRLDLLLGGRVGRLAPLAAALIVAIGMCMGLGLLTSLANSLAGLPVRGSIAFGAGWAMTGIVFACVGAAAAQVTVSARAARGIGLAAIGVTYALRAVGDLAEPGPGVLSWLSPIGWNQQVRAYAGDRWLVLGLPLLASLLVLASAVAMGWRRDLGCGLLPERTHRSSQHLGTVTGLVVRLQRGAFLAWAIGFMAFGLLLGSLSGSVQQLLSSSTMHQILDALNQQGQLLDAFLGAEIAIGGAVAAAYGISAVLRLHAEESAGRTEALIATRVTRTAWIAGVTGTALVAVAILLALMGLSLGIGTAITLQDWTWLERVVVAALAQVPAAWVMACIAMLVCGWAPRLAMGAWALLLACVVLGEFGALWGLPEWLMDASPLRHAPMLPVTSSGIPGLVALCVASAVILAIGSGGWARRDLTA